MITFLARWRIVNGLMLCAISLSITNVWVDDVGWSYALRMLTGAVVAWAVCTCLMTVSYQQGADDEHNRQIDRINARRENANRGVGWSET